MTQIRLMIGLGIIATVCFLVWFVPRHYREEGRQEMVRKYEEASRIALLERNAEIERLKLKHENTNRIVAAEYESKIERLNHRYLAAKRDGLRIPKAACDRPTATTETASAEGNNEAESIRLPEGIEIGLFGLARKADEINAQLSSCQKWIKDQGFYD